MPLHRSAMGVDNFPSFLQFTYVDHTGDCVSAWSIAIRSAREQKKPKIDGGIFLGMHSHVVPNHVVPNE